jgi:enoyl-CoA hydratase
LAEVDNGATTGAIQAIGLMPEKRLRAAMFTCEPVPADELVGYGSVLSVHDGMEATLAEGRRLAEVMAAKSNRILRAAKKSVDLSIARDIEAAYRKELSYTYELNMIGEADKAKTAFVHGSRKGYLSQT